MKARETTLLLFVGICTILIVVIVATGLADAERISGEDDGSRFSASISVTPTIEFDFSELPEEPDVPAHFDEGAPDPTPEPTPEQGS